MSAKYLETNDELMLIIESQKGDLFAIWQLLEKGVNPNIENNVWWLAERSENARKGKH